MCSGCLENVQVLSLHLPYIRRLSFTVEDTVKDPDGNKLIGMFLSEGFTLDENGIALAIPAEKVKYADQLLRDYKARKPSVLNKYKGIGVEVGKTFISFNYK